MYQPICVRLTIPELLLDKKELECFARRIKNLSALLGGLRTLECFVRRIKNLSALLGGLRLECFARRIKL